MTIPIWFCQFKINTFFLINQNQRALIWKLIKLNQEKVKKVLINYSLFLSEVKVKNRKLNWLLLTNIREIFVVLMFLIHVSHVLNHSIPKNDIIISTNLNYQTISLLSNKFLMQYICTIAVPTITDNYKPVRISIYDWWCSCF